MPGWRFRPSFDDLLFFFLGMRHTRETNEKIMRDMSNARVEGRGSRGQGARGNTAIRMLNRAK